MVSRVAVGGSAGYRLLQKVSLMGRCQARTLGTIVATLDQQIIWKWVSESISRHLICLLGNWSSLDVNERIVISIDYRSLLINIGAPSLATCDNCKELLVVNTVVFPSDAWGLAKDSNGIINRCMFLFKYTTSSIWCITLNLKWFGKTG